MDELRPLLDTIDDLRQLGISQTIPLPRIVVVGDQSSGKSSVLQAIANVELPQGTGTVTRCPLVLRMQKDNSGENRPTISISWCGQAEKMIGQASDIVNEVKMGTEALTGGNDRTKFSDKEIQLTIRGPRCPDLTLVDLPGIIRFEEDCIKEKVKSMIRNQIRLKESIIAAVVACGDLDTSEALDLAKEFDPHKERTVGILTKPDLQDPGTNMSKVLLGAEPKYRLRHGYVVVKNRGQRQLEENQSWAEARESEKQYFEEAHQVYKEMPRELFGAESLVRKLQPLLKAILKHLPIIRQALTAKLESCSSEMRSLEDGLPEDASAKLLVATNKVERLKCELNNTLKCDVSVEDAKLRGSVLIKQKHAAFAQEIYKCYLSLRSEEAKLPSLHVDIAVKDRQGSIDFKMDLTCFRERILPLLGINTEQVQLDSCQPIQDVDGKILTISGCPTRDYNREYAKTPHTYNDRPVFKSKTSDHFLFYHDSQWRLSNSVSNTRIAQLNHQNNSPELGDSIWMQYDNTRSTLSDAPDMKIQPVPTAWRISFKIASADEESRGSETTDFIRHIHSDEAKFMFEGRGFRLLGAVKPPPGGLASRIKELMNSCNGPEPPGFSSSGPFKIIMREHLASFREPVYSYVHQMHEIVLSFATDHIDAILETIPPFKKLVLDSTRSLLSDRLEQTLQSARIEIEKEIEFFFTNNKYFYNTVNNIRKERFRKSIIALLQSNPNQEKVIFQTQHGLSNEDEEARDIEDKIVAYYKVVYKRVADTVPMTVQYHMVRPFSELLFKNLMERVVLLHQQGKLVDVLCEDESITAKRTACAQRLSQLRKAYQILGRLNFDSESEAIYQPGDRELSCFGISAAS